MSQKKTDSRPYETLPFWALLSMAVAYREADAPEKMRAVQAEIDSRALETAPDALWSEHFPLVARSVKPAAADDSLWIACDENQVAGFFADDGPLAALMPGYESRPGQLSMAVEVAKAFNGKRHLLVEAGTGVGKSLAYLVPAALWAYTNDQPVVISTNTRNLQTQLLSKDVPVVRAVLGDTISPDRPFRTAVLKGRSNYLCLKALGFLIEQGVTQLENSELLGFAEALPWIVATRDGDLDDLAAEVPGIDRTGITRSLCSQGEECMGRGCRFFRRCFLQKARQRAAESHLIIANHSLVFAEMQIPGSALPPYSRIVFDEAHNLEEAATRHLSLEITPYRLFQLAHRIATGKPGAANSRGLLEHLRKTVVDGAMLGNTTLQTQMLAAIGEAHSLLPGYTKAGADLFTLLYRFVEKSEEPCRYRCVPDAEAEVPAGMEPVLRREIVFSKSFVDAEQVMPEGEITAALKCFADATRAFTELLERMTVLIELLTPEGQLPLCADQVAAVQGVEAQLKGFLDDVKFVLAGSDRHYVFWMERWGRKEKMAQLLAAPLSLAERLAETVYAEKASIVFCSATLRVRESFDHISRRLGISLLPPEKVATAVAESPFDYAQQCVACVPDFLPEPSGDSGGDGKQYALELSRTMYRLFTHAKGRSLGLFTSYEMMKACAAYLEKPLAEKGIRLLVQSTGGSRDQITRVFRSNEEACVLFGTHSFWEGVDVVGDALSCVVMARLPFTAVNDPLLEARCEEIARNGGVPFRELILPQAVIRFRQGFGRLIRSRKDRGIVVVADSRIVKKNYGATFGRSLPVPLKRVKTPENLLTELHSLID